MSSAVPTVLAAKETMKLVGKLIDAAKDYSIARDVEETERLRIRAVLEAVTAQIAAHREIILAELSHRHEERLLLYRSLVSALESATRCRDIELSKWFSDQLVKIYESGARPSVASPADALALLREPSGELK